MQRPHWYGNKGRKSLRPYGLHLRKFPAGADDVVDEEELAVFQKTAAKGFGYNA